MTFQKIDRMNGDEILTQVELPDFFQAYKTVDSFFERENVFSMEATDYRNGIKAITLRDKKHKILYQLKTLN